MSLVDLLQQYAGAKSAPNDDTAAHYDEVARSATPDDLGRGITEALRSDQTPPFGDMVSQLFGRSNAGQQAGVVNQLLGALGPGALGMAGGVLGRILGQAGGGQGADGPHATPPSLTPEQASQLSPEQVKDIAAQAESRNPGIVDQIGSFYGQHPELVKGLGGMALALVLGRMARR